MRTTRASIIDCPACGHPAADEALSCSMCGEVLRREPTTAPGPQTGRGLDAAGLPVASSSPPPGRPGFGRVADEPEITVEVPRRIAGLPEPLFWFLAGVPLALLFASGPFMRSYAWFLGALFHEFGHTLAGLAFGLPSFPAISLRGHAVTVHQDQVLVMVWAILATLGYGAWHFRARRGVAIPLGVAAAIYPLIAFTGAKEFVFVVAGHCGELAFAWLCLFRAFAGMEFRWGAVERGAYSAVGWLFVGSNVGLCWGLATSAVARDDYSGSGSFGLTNDYIRVAEDVLGWSLPGVAWLMLLVSLLPVPLALLAGWVRTRD
jgi:hypothetical protein